MIRNNSEQASSPVVIRRQKEKLLEQYLEMFTHSSSAPRACAMNVQQNKTEMPAQCMSAGSFAASHPPLRSPRSTTWPIWRPRGSRLVQSDCKAAFDQVAQRPAPGRRGVFLVTCRRDPQTPTHAKEYLNSLDHQPRAQKLTIICNRPSSLAKQLQCVSIAAPSRPCVPMAKARTCSFGILRPKPSRTPARHPESM